MKKVFIMTAFAALMLSSQAFAVNMDYNNDTDTSTTTVAPDNATTATTNVTTHHRHHKKIVRTKSSYMNNGVNQGHHTNAGPVPSGSVDMNDNATSRQGMPSGETNGPINGQSDDQNYGQPTNH